MKVLIYFKQNCIFNQRKRFMKNRTISAKKSTSLIILSGELVFVSKKNHLVTVLKRRTLLTLLRSLNFIQNYDTIFTQTLTHPTVNVQTLFNNINSHFQQNPFPNHKLQNQHSPIQSELQSTEHTYYFFHRNFSMQNDDRATPFSITISFAFVVIIKRVLGLELLTTHHPQTQTR